MCHLSTNTILYICIQILICVCQSDQHVIKLFNTYHFIETDIALFDQQLDGSFNSARNIDHLIIGDEPCSVPIKTKIQNLKHENYESDYDIISDPLLYSTDNYELSFMLSISFDTLFELENNQEFKGYEIKFKNFDNLTSCLKILPNNFMTKKLRRIKITIKDPSFVTQQKKDYTFYFAQVSVNFLVDCGKNSSTSEYCSEFEVRSKTLDVGIKSNNKSIDTSKPFETNMCKGDFNQYTCIMRHESKNDNYYIVMQPGTDQFEYIIGNINRLSLKNNESFVSKNTELWSNNLFYKLIRTNSQIFYLGEFKNPTEKNFCNENKNNKYCNCNGKCIQCSSKSGDEEIIRAVVLEDEDESKHCSNNFYSAYSFKNILIETSFMNQKLDKKKNLFNKKETFLKNKKLYDFNLEFMNSLCFETVTNDYSEFSFNLHFENVYKASMTNIFRVKNYFINIYLIDSKNLKYNPVLSSFREHLYDVDLKIVDSKTIDVNVNKMIEFRFKKDYLNKNFLIELSAEWNNTLCPRSNMCIDESVEKNRIQCIDSDYCAKKIYFFKIKEFTKSLSCEKDEKNRFSLIISHLLGSNIDYNQGNQDQDEKILFYKAQVPAYFSSKNLKLPFDFINYDSNVKKRLTATELSILIVFCFLCPILMFLIVIYFYYQTIKINLFHTEKMNVLFYISINIDNDAQKKLNNLVSNMLAVLKKWLTRIEFYSLMHNTKNRSELLENADLIVYVCATDEEIHDIENNYMKIGQNNLHDEFNKIHFLGPIKRKCIDIAFSTTSDSKLNKKTKTKIKKCDTGSSFTDETILNIPLFDSSTNQVNSLRKIYRLPDENKDFLLDFKRKLTVNKISDRNFNLDCKSKIINKSQKCLLNYIFYRIDSNFRSIIRKKYKKKDFEQINFDFYNQFFINCINENN